MSLSDRSVFHIARFVLECRTPLSIATGFEGFGHDTELVTDANGVPALPGSALAGVLRHLYRREHGDEEALFGYQRNREGIASRLHVAWGALLDGEGRPVEGLLTGEDTLRLERDPVLRAVQTARRLPVLRDRVRLNHRGTAVEGAKFDRTLLPAGHRFACEITLRSDKVDDPQWHNLLALLHHPLLRLGGATRAGLGALRPVTLHTASFDLTKADAAAAFSALGPSLADYRGLHETPPDAASPTSTHALRCGWLHLRPRHFWRIGQGDAPLGGGLDKTPDLKPKREQRLTWHGARHGEFESRLVIPGSAIKGAIAHRVAFHANRLAGRFADDDALWQAGEPIPPPEVAELFGQAKEGAEGQAGRLIIEDVDLPEADFEKEATVLKHNVIDRFTGGVRNRLLFDEQLLWRGALEIPMFLDQHRGPLSERAETALRMALDDLCAGRLPIGGGASRGHGHCDGEYHWEPAREGDA